MLARCPRQDYRWLGGLDYATLIADLSVTTFCDMSGAPGLLTAHKQAAADGARLRVAVPSGAVRRMLTLLGLDTALQVFRASSRLWLREVPAARDPTA